MELTDDAFLGGALTLLQPKDGYRIAMDTVLLGAAIPAKSGDSVLDLGTGTGGAALCLARRVTGAHVTGVEIHPVHADLARRNAERNDLEMTVIEGSLLQLPADLKKARFDHVMANPPYLDPARHDAPPGVSKGGAHMEGEAGLADWVRVAFARVKDRGTVTFVYRADRLHELLGLMAAKGGDIRICPLWPRPGVPAKRVIVQARKGAKGPLQLLAGLTLHGDASRYTPEAEAILRAGAALEL